MTLERWALVAYLGSLVVFVVVALLRGGIDELPWIGYMSSTLAVLFSLGLWRYGAVFDETVGAKLVGTWLNLSLLIGTRMNLFRVALNSADLSRLKGPWIDHSATRKDPRYVRPPRRWPALTLFFVGAALMFFVVLPRLGV